MLKYTLNYDVKEAGFTSLLTPPEGIDDPQHPKGTSAFKPGYWLQFPAAYPASIRWRRSYILRTLPARKYCVCLEVSGKGASEPSRSAARVRGRDCQMVFPSPIPIGYPAHMEHNSSGVWFGHGNDIWFGDTFCSGPHRH